MNGTVSTNLPRRRAWVWRAAAALVAGALAALGSPLPGYADWVRSDEWQLTALNVQTAWHYANGAGVTVGVVDSGVDYGHPDLAGQVLPGADFVDGSTDGRRDPVGHGTTVAALIAGRADDTAGVAGIAPAAKILPVRVLDEQNKYDDATAVAGGLRWAVDHGATVVNLSLGGAARSDALAGALAYAAARDVVVIACTGNATAGESFTDVWYPAREPGVVAVAGLAANPATGAATRRTDTHGVKVAGPSPTASKGTAGAEQLWTGSLTGPETVLTAPAVDLLGARPGGYWRVQGTSFAAPLVTATATLIRSRWPDLDAPNVVNRLISTARDLGVKGRDDKFGYGEVDPVRALTATVQPVVDNPLDLGDQEVGDAVADDPDRDDGGSGGPATPTLARPAALTGSTRLMVSAGVGGLVFLALLAAGLTLIRRRPAR
jgi:subtilisin family serine protease